MTERDYETMRQARIKRNRKLRGYTGGIMAGLNSLRLEREMDEMVPIPPPSDPYLDPVEDDVQVPTISVDIPTTT